MSVAPDEQREREWGSAQKENRRRKEPFAMTTAGIERCRSDRKRRYKVPAAWGAGWSHSSVVSGKREVEIGDGGVGCTPPWESG